MLIFGIEFFYSFNVGFQGRAADRRSVPCNERLDLAIHDERQHSSSGIYGTPRQASAWSRYLTASAQGNALCIADRQRIAQAA